MIIKEKASNSSKHGLRTKERKGACAKGSPIPLHPQLVDIRGLGVTKPSRTTLLKLKGFNSVCRCQGGPGGGQTCGGRAISPEPESGVWKRDTCSHLLTEQGQEEPLSSLIMLCLMH